MTHDKSARRASRISRWIFIAAFITIPQTLRAASDIDPGQPMDQVIERFRADRDALQRFYEAVHPSPFYLDRLNTLYGEWLEKIATLNFDSLDQQGRIDYLMLRDTLVYDQATIKRQRAKLADIDPLIPFRPVIQDLESARSRMLPLEAEPAATKLTAIPDQIKKLRERIEKGRKEKEKDKEKGKGERGRREKRMRSPMPTTRR